MSPARNFMGFIASYLIMISINCIHWLEALALLRIRYRRCIHSNQLRCPSYAWTARLVSSQLLRFHQDPLDGWTAGFLRSLLVTSEWKIGWRHRWLHDLQIHLVPIPQDSRQKMIGKTLHGCLECPGLPLRNFQIQGQIALWPGVGNCVDEGCWRPLVISILFCLGYISRTSGMDILWVEGFCGTSRLALSVRLLLLHDRCLDYE